MVAAIVATRTGYKWDTIQEGMLKGIANSLQAIVILLIIGILIGVWIVSGVVPTLLYYGLKILSPEIFLPAAVVICAITSLATGTSWGTTGTIGVALMGNRRGTRFSLAAGRRSGAFRSLLRRQDVAALRHHEPRPRHGGDRYLYPYPHT